MKLLIHSNMYICIQQLSKEKLCRFFFNNGNKQQSKGTTHVFRYIYDIIIRILNGRQMDKRRDEIQRGCWIDQVEFGSMYNIQFAHNTKIKRFDKLSQY